MTFRAAGAPLSTDSILFAIGEMRSRWIKLERQKDKLERQKRKTTGHGCQQPTNPYANWTEMKCRALITTRLVRDWCVDSGKRR